MRLKKSVDSPKLELVCTVYNTNTGENEELLHKCSVLKDYMIFVDYVREYRNTYGEENIAMAVDAAIDRCIRENVLVEFMKERREEITKTMELDFTFERQIELERKSSRQEGYEEAQKEMLLCVKQMHNGMTRGELLQQGFAEKTIETAEQIMQLCK